MQYRMKTRSIALYLKWHVHSVRNMVDQNGFHREAIRSTQIRWVYKVLMTFMREIG
jgi:hypothetical protein